MPYSCQCQYLLKFSIYNYCNILQNEHRPIDPFFFLIWQVWEGVIDDGQGSLCCFSDWQAMDHEGLCNIIYLPSSYSTSRSSPRASLVVGWEAGWFTAILVRWPNHFVCWHWMCWWTWHCTDHFSDCLIIHHVCPGYTCSCLQASHLTCSDSSHQVFVRVQVWYC